LRLFYRKAVKRLTTTFKNAIFHLESGTLETIVVFFKLILPTIKTDFSLIFAAVLPSIGG